MATRRPASRTLIVAAGQVETVRPDGKGIEEVVGDKGYHSNQSLVDLEAVGVRSYISEPDRGRRSWKKNPAARDAVYRNRRRIRAACAANSCCAGGANAWNGRLLISMKPDMPFRSQNAANH